ncbi:hypothetical protein [Rhizobium jaguaris]|uniref:hypothetical protein n=1 Tax=Rhizobium jaguaris TaxID=1312183 RepID=UPI0013C50A50
MEEAVDHARQHEFLTAMQVVSAGRVDHQSIRRIGGNDRRVASQRPECQAFKRLRVGCRIRVHYDEVGNQRLGLGRLDGSRT